MKTYNKQGQTEIIVTVLLVLIALAAVATIAYFIMGQVRGGTDQATNKANCLKLDFQITKAIANDGNITVLRNDEGSIELKELKVIANGATVNSSAAAPKSLETVKISLTSQLTAGQKVEVGAVLENGATCPAIASATVTAS